MLIVPFVMILHASAGGRQEPSDRQLNLNTDNLFLAAISFEIIGLIMALLCAPRCWGFAPRSAGSLLAVWSRVADHRRSAVLFTGVAGGLIAASFSIVQYPTPRILDEYCYLLSADTFANGRVTNPAHPHWEHFENICVLQQPTYQSKYPPGQGILLAAGQTLGGHPIFGVWLGTAIACAATCWMLQGWVPSRWALWGGLLPVTRFGIFLTDHMQWSRSYWGGMVALTGGALLFGGIRRIARKPNWGSAAVAAAGLVTLSLSRPFEGLVAGICGCGYLLLIVCRRRDRAWRQKVIRSLWSAAMVLSAGTGFLCYYNYRVTLDPLRLPYVEEGNQYDPIPNFAWGDIAEQKTYRHAQLRNFYESVDAGGLADQYDSIRGWKGRLGFTLKKLASAWVFFLGPVLTFPFIVCGRDLWRRTWDRFAIVTLFAGLTAFIVVNWRPVHYLAPFASLITVLVIQALRRLASWRSDGVPVGRFVVAAIIAMSVASFLIAYAELLMWTHRQAPTAREEITARLEQHPGDHLVLVRYAPDQATGYSWVYNSANIDAQRIVWAREMTDEKNRELMRYYPTRSVWLLHAGQSRARIQRYGE